MLSDMIEAEFKRAYNIGYEKGRVDKEPKPVPRYVHTFPEWFGRVAKELADLPKIDWGQQPGGSVHVGIDHQAQIRSLVECIGILVAELQASRKALNREAQKVDHLAGKLNVANVSETYGPLKYTSHRAGEVHMVDYIEKLERLVAKLLDQVYGGRGPELRAVLDDLGWK